MSGLMIPEAFFDDANAAAGFAEQEASDLRVKLREMTEGMIAVKLAGWRYHQTFIPLMRRLRRFNQISDHECIHFVECQAKDAATIDRDIEAFRAAYGVDPKYHGKPVTSCEEA